MEEVQRELAKMAEPMRRDVELIRERLEAVDRDLAFADKDYTAKKRALEAAEALLEKKRKEKKKKNEPDIQSVKGLWENDFWNFHFNFLRSSVISLY